MIVVLVGGKYERTNGGEGEFFDFLSRMDLENFTTYLSAAPTQPAKQNMAPREA